MRPTNQIQKITGVFESIPAQKILQIAKDIQDRHKNDQTLAQKRKSDDEWGWVTKADTEIQRLIIKHFAESSLKATYILRAEEDLEKTQRIQDNGKITWQLLIDPLDGTNSFREQKKIWGTMIGACDLSGVLRYAWNLVSTGEIYKTENSKSIPATSSFSKRIQDGKPIAIDVYDYKAGASEEFKNIFEKVSGLKLRQYKQTSYPAAVWAGWELFRGNLNGLLWISSDKGKKWYPDYDLIFLGTLKQKGLKVQLAKINENNALITVAPTEEDLAFLYETGLHMIPEKQRSLLTLTDNPLQITNFYDCYY